MNGIHEVVGSIPTRSTNSTSRDGPCWALGALAHFRSVRSVTSRAESARSVGLAVLLLVALLGGCTTAPLAPRAVAGVIDLTTWSPVLDGPVRLDGEWAFLWKRLVDANDTRALDATETFTPVPGSWPGTAGFATYRLRVLLPPGTSRLALRLLTVSTAYRLYADGDLIAERGKVAEDAASGKPDYEPVIVDLAARENGSLDLVLQASNFHYAKGGAWEPIWLGDPAGIRKLREDNVALTLFLVGSFAIIGLYHVFIWAARRSDPSALYFAIMSFGVTARILTVDEMLLVTLVPDFPWSLHVKIEYISMIVIAAILAPFLRTLFPNEVPAWVVKGVVLTGLAMGLFVLVTPPVVFSQGLPLLQVYLVGGTLAAPVLAARAVFNGRAGAWLFLLGLLSVTVAGFHDTLLSIFRDLPTMLFLGGSIYILPYALFICALSQAIVLAMRFSGAYTQLERATDELRDAHAELDAYAHELEERVADRTSDLERANQKLARLASIDGLTLVGNRRFFDDALSRLWAEHERRGATLSLLLCDVDHFKHFNDTHGHVQGDNTLRAVAGVLSQAANRPGDTVARYGGDEMVLLLPDTDDGGAREVGERVLRQVAELAIPHDASKTGPIVTVSVGVATLVPDRRKAQAHLIELADAGLYEAKKRGRNCVAAA